MKVLVTGGAGFIGSAVCRLLVGETGDQVVNLDKLTYAAAPGSLAAVEGRPGYTFLRADIVDREAVRAAFEAHRPDAVLHMAAETHVDRSIDDPDVFVRTNVVGASVLLDEALRYWRGLRGGAKEAFRFVHLSTDEVYGALGEEGRFREDTPYAPNSPYAASKAGSDHLVAAWGHTYGLPTIIANSSNNYGPYQFPEKLIPLTVLNALEGRPLPVYGDGRQVRDWLFVEDHARALRLILERGGPGERYNVGASAERRNIDVVRTVCDLVDELEPGARSRHELISFVPDRPGHDRRYAVDAAKLTTELGWRPSASFEEGLRRTVLWYRDNRAWWAPLRERYAGQRLGLTEPA